MATEHDPDFFDPSRPGGWGYRPKTPMVGPFGMITDVPMVGVDGKNPSLHMVFTQDGVYLPAVAKFPSGPGPFPAVIMIHGGSGGLGHGWLVDSFVNRGCLFDRMVAEGYAVFWTEGRREIPGAYGTDIEARLDHLDVIDIFRYVQSLDKVDARKVAFFGVSHGGELQLKIAAEIGPDGPAALVPAEPAVHEFLGLKHEGGMTEEDRQYRQLLDDGQIEIEKAMERVARIDPNMPILLLGRDDDHLQGLFMKLHQLLKRAGKRVEWESAPHSEHAYHWGPYRSRKVVAYHGAVVEVDSGYELDELQTKVQDRVLNFLNEHVRDAPARGSRAA